MVTFNETELDQRLKLARWEFCEFSDAHPFEFENQHRLRMNDYSCWQELVSERQRRAQQA